MISDVFFFYYLKYATVMRERETMIIFMYIMFSIISYFFSLF